MALYARVEKLSEDDAEVRYKFTDIRDNERVLILDKAAERTRPEDADEDVLYRAVAMKVATAWVRDGVAPDRLLVQS
ncbi:hypothetical protein K7472_17140 [Streptomyces sp. PTM05]|uniref:Uncharacterized protein n=1 Tax=Streptantibioticus parmotrematis TaxID=2873249 RepID=A0ABS7QUI9_9ACTN|nr:hypothetical protein [Streptantibioticus parmotrematis]MBY8886578.1 hypothetical protein [Streptantibioticus parmotrematis]